MRAELEAAIDAMQKATKAVNDIKYRLSNFELLDGSSPLVRVDWRPRSENPPAGHVWASDGDGVWIIHCDGSPIPGSATSVKWWTKALIPMPPNTAKIIDGELATPALTQG
jgi:hypothetical protein